MKPKISLIIPVYNVEEYISECIQSILSQEYHNYEIILVDDGSTDNSAAICDEYSEKYSFIKVIHKSNGGLSDARNAGIDNTDGEFILFIDSDDYIERSSLKKIVNVIDNLNVIPDIVFLEGVKIFPDGSIAALDNFINGKSINNNDKNAVLNYIASLSKFPGSVCTKLIRRNFLTDNSLYFQKDLLSEDIDWMINALLKAENYGYCESRYYYYRQNRNGSITFSAGLKSVESLLFIISKWSSFQSDHTKEINSVLAYEYMIMLFNYSKLNKSSKNKVRDSIRKYKYVMNYARTRKTKLVSLSLKILGVDLTSGLLKAAYKFC
ncbi:MAG: glycosyltransferase [Oscillospiraceae bacterium]|nr:glycosyltransferase [Oscillospiraceae bacterium]